MLQLERHLVILKMKHQTFHTLLDSYVPLQKNDMLYSLYLFTKMSPEITQDFFFSHTLCFSFICFSCLFRDLSEMYSVCLASIQDKCNFSRNCNYLLGEKHL